MREVKFARDVAPGDQILCRYGYCIVETTARLTKTTVTLHVQQVEPNIGVPDIRPELGVITVNENATVHMREAPRG